MPSPLLSLKVDAVNAQSQVFVADGREPIRRIHYPVSMRVLHWTIAALLMVELGLGWRVGQPPQHLPYDLLQLHKSVGLTLLFLMLLRIERRRAGPLPPKAAIKPMEHRLAKLVHVGVYVTLLALPLSGWLWASSDIGTHTRLFGLIQWPAVPGIMGLSRDRQQAVGMIAGGAHRTLVYAVYLLVGLHVAGALKHHLIDRDATLDRMFAGVKGPSDWRVPALVLSGAALVLAGAGLVERNLPGPVATLLGYDVAAAPLHIDPAKTSIFAGLIQPTFADKCYACHGPSKQNGGLRLDSFAAISKGGESGPIITPGKSDTSLLVRRILLPPSDKDAMPPAGHGGLTPAEGELLIWWIDTGASDTLKIADAKASPLIAATLAGMGAVEIKPDIFAIDVPSAAPSALAGAQQAGFQVSPVALNRHFLEARLRRGSRADTALLAPLAGQLVWLDLSGAEMSRADVAALASLRQLDRLDVSSTGVSDDDLRAFSALPKLRALNLYGTAVSDRGLAAVARIPALTMVFLSASRVTAGGIEGLSRARPQLKIVWSADIPQATADGKPIQARSGQP
jgi:cytochrome b561